MRQQSSLRTSLLMTVVTLASPAAAATIDYPNGSTNPAPIVLADNSTQLQVLAGSATQSGLISQAGGTWGLEKIGGGTLILTANNSYTGTTTISAGTLQLGNSGGTTGFVAGPITDNGVLVINITKPSANQVISGTGSVIINNGASLGANNTYTGGTTLNSGTLDFGFTGSGTLAATGALTINGGTVSLIDKTNLSVGTLSGLGGRISMLQSAFSFTTTSSMDSQWAGDVTGGRFFKQGSGTLTVSGNLSSTRVFVSGGTIKLASGVQMTAVTVNGGTILDLNGSSPQLTTLLGSGTVALGGGTLSLAPGITGDADFSGTISGNGNVIADGFHTTRLLGDNSYTGTTTIQSNATLQVGNGGATGTLGSNTVINNGALIVNRSGTITLTISGSGTITKLGTGTLILTGGGGSAPSLNAAPVDSPSGADIFVKSGFNALSASGANSLSGTINLNEGALQAGSTNVFDTAAVNLTAGTTLAMNGFSSSIGSLAGTGNVTLGSATLTAGTNNSDTTFSGLVTGTGSLVKAGTGTLALTGANTYTGGTTVNGGTLQLGAGGSLASTGTLTIGNGTFDLNGQTQTVDALFGTSSSGRLLLGNGTLTVNTAGTGSLLATISGTGKLVKAGTGTQILLGAHTYTGDTTINGGTLAVNGSITSAVTVSSGGTLGGTGTVTGATTLSSGATLAPGNSVGTLTINGNLSLQAGSTYAAEINPNAADKVTVSGIASVNGTLTASFAAGTYTPASYTLISSTGGLSGTFANFNTPGLPVGYRTRLSYDGNNVFLLLEHSELVALLGGGTAGQNRVASAIDRVVASGGNAPSAFAPLYNLSGSPLGTALDQMIGQIGVQSAQAVSTSFQPFLQLILDEDGAGNLSLAQYGPGKTYADADAPKQAQLAPGELRLWSAVYGGSAEYDGNATASISALQSNGWRFAGGVQQEFGDGFMLGASLAAGKDNYRTGNDQGRTSDVSVAVQARKTVSARGYIAAAMGFGMTDIETTRIITVSGTDVLRGKFDADSFGGRVEVGYGFDLNGQFGLTPFAALTGQQFATPAYTETAVAGSSAFALSYQASTVMLGHTELGARLGRSFATENGNLDLEATLGWTHSYNDPVMGLASFQALPNSSFQIQGVTQAADNALLGLKLGGRERNGLFYGVRIDSSLAGSSNIVTGSGNLGWRF